MPDNTEEESYYLAVTISVSGSGAGEGQAGPRYFYKTTDRQLAEQLVERFTRKLGQDTGSDQPQGPVFSVIPSSEMDTTERFLADEQLDEVASEIKPYVVNWYVDASEMNWEVPFAYDPNNPPIYNEDEPLSSASLYHRAYKWEDKLRPAPDENPWEDEPTEEAEPAKTKKKRNRPTAQDMVNRNRAVMLAAAEIKSKYDRLPTVGEIMDATGYSRDEIYATNAYKENKIAKKSAKLTSEMTGSSTTSTEHISKQSVQHTRASRQAKSDQDELEALVDEQEKDSSSNRA